MKPLLVIDMSALLHRAYHGATRGNADYWTKKTKISAVNWILAWVRTAKNKHNANVACAFDGDKSFRTTLLPTYKISRGGGPDADLNGKPCYDIMAEVIEECKMNGYATGW
jgi:5'-3' exonuclease